MICVCSARSGKAGVPLHDQGLCTAPALLPNKSIATCLPSCTAAITCNEFALLPCCSPGPAAAATLMAAAMRATGSQMSAAAGAACALLMDSSTRESGSTTSRMVSGHCRLGSWLAFCCWCCAASLFGGGGWNAAAKCLPGWYNDPTRCELH
jgi:hypothetical protein